MIKIPLFTLPLVSRVLPATRPWQMNGPKMQKMRLELASINVAPKGGGNSHSGATIFIFQDDRVLEEFVEEFVNHYHLTTCDDLTLMEEF